MSIFSAVPVQASSTGVVRRSACNQNIIVSIALLSLASGAQSHHAILRSIIGKKLLLLQYLSKTNVETRKKSVLTLEDLQIPMRMLDFSTYLFVHYGLRTLTEISSNF